MLHKYKIYFDVENPELQSLDWENTFNITSELKLNNEYKLVITIVGIKGTAFISIFVIDINNFYKHVEIKYKTRFNFNDLKSNLLRFCKAYELHINDDTFIIDICSNNTVEQIKANGYIEQDIINVLTSLNFKKDIELIDACIYVLYHESNEEIKELFIHKSLYLGYQDKSEILGLKSIKDAENDILDTEVNNIESILRKFYEITVLYLQDDFVEPDKFLYGILENDYKKILKLKLDELKKYPVLFKEK